MNSHNWETVFGSCLRISFGCCQSIFSLGAVYTSVHLSLYTVYASKPASEVTLQQSWRLAFLPPLSWHCCCLSNSHARRLLAVKGGVPGVATATNFVSHTTHTTPHTTQSHNATAYHSTLPPTPHPTLLYCCAVGDTCTYQDCERRCQSHGAHVASIHSNTENNHVWNVVGGRGSCYLGLADIQREGHYIYPDGSSTWTYVLCVGLGLCVGHHALSCRAWGERGVECVLHVVCAWSA